MTTARSLAIAAFLALPLVASAGESGGAPNEATTAGKAPEAGSSVDKLKMGADLADMGREQKSPEMLLSAAQILASVPAEGREPKKTEKAADKAGEKDAKATEKADQPAPTLDPAKLQQEALVLAQASGDKGLTKYVEAQIKKGVGTRGASGGAKYTVTKVNAGSTDIYNVEFRGGELAEVAISGDGDTDLDIYVYDEYGNSIATDTSYGDTGHVSWYPRWTGGFRVEVRNNGMVYNQYVLITN